MASQLDADALPNTRNSSVFENQTDDEMPYLEDALEDEVSNQDWRVLSTSSVVGHVFGI